MLRHCLLLLCVLSLALSPFGPASGAAFVNLGAMAPLSYYNAIPQSINANGVVTMQGYSTAFHGANQYYHTYLYTGGTAGTLNDITSPFGSMTTSSAQNGNGQMAVQSLTYGNGYLYSGGIAGSVTSYKFSTYNTYALAINGNGDEAGYYVNTANSNRWTPFVYTGGTAYSLNVPGTGYTSQGAGIVGFNTSGQAVGICTPGNPPGVQAAVWTYTISGGTVTSQTATTIHSAVHAQYASALSDLLVAINSSGTAVGSWSATYAGSMQLSGVGGSFLYDVGTQSFTSLGTLLVGSPAPGSLSHQAGQSQAINDSGVVAGCIVNAGNSSGYDAAVWQSGTVTDLNTLYASILPGGFVLDNATAIDNNGNIAGYGHDASSHVVQAWVIYVPEPGTLVLLAAALAGLVTYAWRKPR